VSIVGYHIAYLIGVTPWDRGTIPPPLIELVEGPERLPPERAIDLGCGTGTQAIYLARHGWLVTAIDLVARSLRTARQKAQRAGVSVEWVLGDVARLTEVVRGGYSLLFDYGCFHGLADAAREQYTQGASAVAIPGAFLLLGGFAPGRRGPLPRGVSRIEIEARFSRWEVRWAKRDSGPPLPRFLANADPTWYLLRRR
jgi:SAM-dependent methyltransferase